MQTEIIKITKDNSKEVLTKAENIIKSGGLVVFPTETVYGLGASVFNNEALKKIYLAKGRPSDNPLIVHVSNKDQLKELVEHVGETENKLIDAFWPGPLTIIFKKKQNISNIISGGLDTLAIRMPSNSFAHNLIELVGPIAAPSANASGRPSGTKGEDIYKELSGKVEMIIDEGESNIGVESTVIKIEENKILILRPGAVTKEMLEKFVSIPVVFSIDKNDLKSSPGTRYKHYAPQSKLEIIYATENIGKEMLLRASFLEEQGYRIGIICTDINEIYFKKYEPNVFLLGNENKLEEVSQKLYSALRFFDNHSVDVILCQSFKEEGLGVAIMDRLKRASSEN